MTSIPILMYHQIDASPQRGTPLRGLVVKPQAFQRQMRFLKVMGYQGLSMKDLEPYLNGTRQGKVVGITFDDGYLNNLAHALPALQANGFTATCYGISELLGKTNAWDRAIGVPEKPLMSVSDWKAWHNAGMDVGSHTQSHAQLDAVSQAQARAEISISKSQLEQFIGAEVRHFCYPYGKYSQAHVQMVKDAGYVTATTTRRGRVFQGSDFYELPRIMVAHATHLALFAMKVMTNYESKRS